MAAVSGHRHSMNTWQQSDAASLRPRCGDHILYKLHCRGAPVKPTALLQTVHVGWRPFCGSLRLQSCCEGSGKHPEPGRPGSGEAGASAIWLLTGFCYDQVWHWALPGMTCWQACRCYALKACCSLPLGARSLRYAAVSCLSSQPASFARCCLHALIETHIETRIGFMTRLPLGRQAGLLDAPAHACPWHWHILQHLP